MATRERAVELGPQDVEIERLKSGIILARSPYSLGEIPRTITTPLLKWASETPDAVLVARRGPDGEWRKLTYAQFTARMESIAAALLVRVATLWFGVVLGAVALLRLDAIVRKAREERQARAATGPVG